MTDDNAFKRKARKHQQATGDSYTRARRQVDDQRADTADATPTATLLKLLDETTSLGPSAPALQIPAGLQPDGTPIWLDLRDEHEGGSGPHGLITGTTGSGKSTALMSLIFALCIRHSPDEVQLILGDPRKHSIADTFADFPHVRACFTDLERVDRSATEFVDTIRSVLAERTRILADAGPNGAPFDTISDYHQAHAAPNSTLPALPFLIVVVDDVYTLHRSRPTLLDALDVLTRKGRALGVHLLASTSRISSPRPLFDNTTCHIVLRTATEAESRRLLGTVEAAHLPAARPGAGWLVTKGNQTSVAFNGFHPSRSAISAAARRFAPATQQQPG
ncbi:DNA segregation ATPase, FtsK/SpoIIIE family (plasmid) [Mycobacterium sp. JS623]|uniref:FtsK/SpoIIIE domain-containing protein n=1 Tax=Mycobacterium sp. JS623 TaxID=212767 RepID=UPI0002A5521C|nr:FtsK/SpoIIIE domain-containing protein [Mycobacterium sp. JS623]AGB27286.1 DNA segregation ATPase, FtsK/SpoIIIE family [Mycobacterium sp. JS623]